MAKTKVELHSAFQWDCDECGCENFCRGVTAELNEEDKQHMIEDHGVDPEYCGTGDWMLAPETVKCDHCGAEFETEEQV